MGETRPERKLAAVLAADLVGYSRLMEADEAGTLARLKAVRTEAVDPRIAEYGGRIVKTTGDGLLCEFASAVDAVQCALAVQRAMADRTAGEPEDSALKLRVGVNLGDIIIEGEDIFGDGVNVAARLEALAEPGGVCISGTAHDTLRGALADEFADEGERSVKNIARPLRVFSWRGSGPGRRQEPVARAEAGRKPTIALDAFEAVGADPEAESLAAAVRDAVDTALSNLSGMALMADPERADFVATASFQARGGRYRATAKLEDRSAGRHFWSERFDGDLSDPFAAQDDLAYRMSGAIRFAVYIRAWELADGRSADDADTETLLSRAGFLVTGTDHDAWLQGRAMAEKVLERDPENYMAFAIKAISHLYVALNSYREIALDDLAAAAAAARRAVDLNGQSDFAHAMLSIVHLQERDNAAARREAERGLDLNPHSPIAGLVLGQALIFGGDPEAGIPRCMQAAEILKRMPMYYSPLHSVAIGHFVCARYGESRDWAARAAQQAPDHAAILMLLTAAAALDGDMEAARASAERLLAAHPRFGLTAARRWPFADTEPWERLIAGLRMAGLPE